MSDLMGLKYVECPRCKEYGFTEDSEYCVYCKFGREDAEFQWECARLEKESQNDTEYVNRIAKMKTEAYLGNISK